MSFINSFRNPLQSALTHSALYRWLTNALAALILAIILALNILLWPVPALGFTPDPRTATIVSVTPDSSAARAGVQVGDRVLRVYNRPWDTVRSHPNLLVLIGPHEQPIPLTVERNGSVYSFELVQELPSLATQIAKLTGMLLALICWFTGYVLGIVRRHEAEASPLVAWFWLCLGAVLGSYAFARSLSYPLMLTLQWLLLTLLVPLAVYIHVWFPVRSVPTHQARIAHYALIGGVVLLNAAILLSILVWQPTQGQLIFNLSIALSIAVFVGLIGIGVILYRAYQRANVEHLRRQIRLIVTACFLVACLWLLLLILPRFIYGQPLIADQWIDLLAGAVPLAYLLGGIVPDLYRVDRVMLRLGGHIGTTVVLAGALAILITLAGLHDTATIMWIAICFVVLYRPVQNLGYRLFPASINPLHNAYQPLHRAATKLTTSLDAPVLLDAVYAGVRATFGEPALGFYLGDIEGSNRLTLVLQERFHLPETIDAGVLTEHLCELAPITESRAFYAVLAETSPTASEEVLRYKGVVLWCPLRHTQGYLLGLLLLGMRGDLDPYRAEDIRELQRLLEATALALANSAAYGRQCVAEERVYQLYQCLKEERAVTAAAIARELHDEIINVNVRLNIESLQQLIVQVSDPAIRAELDALLESEHTIAQILRMVCEQLHPTGIDDPLGLPALLRMQSQRIKATWSGSCHLIVEHTPCPIAPATQREVLGVVTEALSNAIKHAAATEITILLRYPETPDDLIQLIVCDNGRSGKIAAPRPGHLGMHSMHERARTIGGTLQFRQEGAGGTAVVLSFPPQVPVALVSRFPYSNEYERRYATV